MKKLSNVLYIRHKFSTTQRVLEHLHKFGYIAIHFSNILCPQDATSIAKLPKFLRGNAKKLAHQIEILNDYCEREVIVFAEYCFPGVGSKMIMGKLAKRPSRRALYFFKPNEKIFTEAGNIPKKKKENIHRELYKDGYLCYQVARLKNFIDIAPFSHIYMLIKANQARATFQDYKHKPALENILLSFFNRNKIKITSADFFLPEHLEVLCYEYILTTAGKLKIGCQDFKLLLPIGRTLKDVDLYGIDIVTNELIFAQVTYQTKGRKVREKMENLLQKKGILIFFSPKIKSSTWKGLNVSGVNFVDIENDVYRTLSINTPYFNLVMDRMING